MHRQIFVATHLGSGASMLVEMILVSRKTARVQRKTGSVYDDPQAIPTMQKLAMKHNEHASVFIDKLMYNYELANHRFLDICDWIYVVREPVGTLTSLVEAGEYTPEGALRYYSYRLRRLCEMAKKSPRKLIVTWDELVDKSSFPAVKSFVGLKELTSIYRPQPPRNILKDDIVVRGRDCYRRHLNFLRDITPRQTPAGNRTDHARSF